MQIEGSIHLSEYLKIKLTENRAKTEKQLHNCSQYDPEGIAMLKNITETEMPIQTGIICTAEEFPENQVLTQ